MDFNLTEEQIIFQNSVRNLAENNLKEHNLKELMIQIFLKILQNYLLKMV